MEPITLEFLQALQDLAAAHNSYSWIEFLPDKITEYIDDFLLRKENIIKSIDREIKVIDDCTQASIENEIKRKEEAALELRTEHRKLMGCGETCDCAEKAKLVRYDIMGWK